MKLNLTTESNRIVRFVKNMDTPIPNKRSNLIDLEELYNDINSARTFVTHNNISVSKVVTNVNTTVDVDRSRAHAKMGGRGFVDKTIRETIQSSMLFSVKYAFRMFDRTYTLVFNVCDITDIDKTDRMFERVVAWLCVADRYSSSTSTCAQKLDIHIFLSGAQKRMPTETIETIGKTHVNSAYTYCCRTDNKIVIYRKEEWFKVFIHETMHAFGLDFCGSTNTSSVVDRHIRPTFDIDSDMNVYEAYCETWATIVNSMFGIIAATHPPTSYSEFTKQLGAHMNTEVAFSTFQMNKVLLHMGLEYRDLYASSGSDGSARRGLLYREDSEVFSYFVVKTILLYHYDLFIAWCGKHNTTLINFSARKKNIESFCKFIISLHKKKGFVDHVDLTATHLDAQPSGRTFVMKSARMSAHSYVF